MNADGSEPDGKKILTVWREDTETSRGFHIDSNTGAFHDPAEWGEALADIALHLAHSATEKGNLYLEDQDGKHVPITIEHFLKRLQEGFRDRLEDPPDYRDGNPSLDAETS